ncbi:hypothetical protein D516_0900 [Rhodobacter sp. AKP1]|nr:hypothetical protein D516_0900 [Rhodobacter sp. AKP1]
MNPGLIRHFLCPFAVHRLRPRPRRMRGDALFWFCEATQMGAPEDRRA